MRRGVQRLGLSGGDEAIGLDAGALTFAEAQAIVGGHQACARYITTCLPGGGRSLGDERAHLLRRGRADTSWPDAEVTLIMAADAISGYLKALLEGVEFRRNTYTLDRQSRLSAIDQMLTDSRPTV